MRKKYGDGDRSQHELRCIARVLEVALLYDQLNVTSLASFELLCHGTNTGALDPMLQKKVMEAVNSRTKQAESLARVAEAKVKHPSDGKGGDKEA